MGTIEFFSTKWLDGLRQKLRSCFSPGISDDELDMALTEYAHGIPPKKVIRDVTPWRNPITDILFGIGFFFVTYADTLESISMATSTALLFAGSASLRETNRFFMAGFYFSIMRVIYVALYFITAPAILNSPGIFSAFSVAGNIIVLSNFLCLFLGIRALTFHNALRSPALSLTLFAVVYITIGAATLAGYRGSSFSSIYELAAMFISVTAVTISFYRYIYKGSGFGYDIVAKPLPHFGNGALLTCPIVLFLICAGIQNLLWQ